MKTNRPSHKTLAENQKFEVNVQALVKYLNEDFHEAPRVKPDSKSQESFQNGGYRIPIEKPCRKNAERKYRQAAKRQTRIWAETMGDGCVVQNIAYCQPWDWRW